MAAQQGKNILLKVYVGGTYITIGGIRTRSISVNGNTVDITNSESGEWRQLKDAVTLNSVSISGAGVFLGDAGIQKIENMIFTNKLGTFRIIFENGDYIDGTFKVTSLSQTGGFADPQTWDITLESASTITLTRPPGYVYYATAFESFASRVFYTQDGVTWNTGSFAGSVYPQRNGRMASNGTCIFPCNAYNTYARSTDFGQSFTQYTNMNVNQTPNFVVTNGFGTWIAGGAYRNAAISTDDGVTWTNITSLIAAAGGNSNYWFWTGEYVASGGFWWLSAYYGDWYSYDDGASWSFVSRNPTPWGVQSPNASFWNGSVLVTNNTWLDVWESSDGISFAKAHEASVSSGIGNDVGYNWDDDVFLCVSDQSGGSHVALMKRETGGVWSNVASNFTFPSVNLKSIAYVGNSRFVIGDQSSGYYETTDNGATFSDISSRISGSGSYIVNMASLRVAA